MRCQRTWYRPKSPSWGLLSGCIVLEASFIPMTCSSCWLKFRSSLAVSSLEQGKRFKAYLDASQIPLAGTPDKVMRLQPNRTEDEREQRKIVTTMLSFLHRVREELKLEKTCSKNGHGGAYLLSASFNPGHEKALWKASAVADYTIEDQPNKMKLVTDEALEEIFAPEFAAASKVFDVAAFKKGCAAYHASKFVN